MKNKIENIFKGIGYTLVLFLSYVMIPSVLAIIIRQAFNLSEDISSFIGNVIYLIGLIIYFKKMFKEKLKDYFKNFTNYFGKSLKYWGIGLLVMIVTNLILNYLVFPGQIATNEEVNRTYLEMNKIIGFIQIVFMAPLAEEMIFRFSIRKITDHKKWFPIISALVFGLPHALTGITTPLELLYTIPYGALGYAFAALYNDTDNIWTNISMHMLHNAVVYIIIILAL